MKIYKNWYLYFPFWKWHTSFWKCGILVEKCENSKGQLEDVLQWEHQLKHHLHQELEPQELCDFHHIDLFLANFKLWVTGTIQYVLLCAWIIHSALCLGDSSPLLQVARFCSLSSPYSMLLNVYVTITLGCLQFGAITDKVGINILICVF